MSITCHSLFPPLVCLCSGYHFISTISDIDDICAIWEGLLR